VLKTYSLKHDKRGEVEGLLKAYNKVLNGMLEDIWTSIRWKKVKIRGKKQFRLLPTLTKDSKFKKHMRDKYLRGWSYSAH
jgi:hypothetical protein